MKNEIIVKEILKLQRDHNEGFIKVYESKFGKHEVYLVNSFGDMQVFVEGENYSETFARHKICIDVRKNYTKEAIADIVYEGCN